MPHLFIAHSSFDELLVKTLTNGIESLGYRCWFYERDGRPGESYLEAEGKAISEADVVLFVATHASIESFEVRKELQFSHKRQKRLLTVLVDKISQQMLEENPELGIILGASIRLNIFGEDTTELVKAIATTLENWQVPYEPRPEPKRKASTNSKLSKLHWASDGMQIQVELLSSFVFVTRTIEQFIRGEQHHFICANKGLGKTLLLRYKRSQSLSIDMANDPQTMDGRGLVLIPDDRPFLDQLTEIPNLSQEKEDSFLADLRNSRRLWAFALRFSCVSHCTYVFEKVPKTLQKPLPANLTEWAIGSRVAPTQIYKHLLSMSHREIHKLLDSSENALDALFRAIQNGVRVFVDRVDESNNKIGREAWINMQAGLIEASWSCMNSNNHVRIYTTIREEAYVNYESATKPNLSGAVVTIRYSKDELREMMDSLSAIYEDCDCFNDFIGFEDVTHNHAGIVEDSFSYLHRHTLGRPRDLVIVCAEISRRNIRGNEHQFRETVKQVGADFVNRSLFPEMSVFLDYLREASNRKNVFSKIPHNVLARQELVDICSEINDLRPHDFGELHAAGSVDWHPFCELWNCGLLGVVERKYGNEMQQQRFKQRYDRTDNSSHSLPIADHYLVHPSLQSVIHSCRDGQGYNVFRGVVVGHGSPWSPQDDKLVQLQRCAFQIKNIELRSEVFQILPFLLVRRNPDRHVRQFAEESISADVELLLAKLEQRGDDDLCLALLECISDLRLM